MPFQVESYSQRQNSEKNLFSDLESTKAALMGLRYRPVDLAELFGISKQGMSKWIAKGLITLDPDRRIDPRVALNQVMTRGDPSKVRAIFLKPIIAEANSLRIRVAELERALSEANDDTKFQEDSASSLVDLFDAFKITLEIEWKDIRALPPEHGLHALLAWLDFSLQHGIGHRTILECLPASEQVPTSE